MKKKLLVGLAIGFFAVGVVEAAPFVNDNGSDGFEDVGDVGGYTLCSLR